MTDRTRYVVVAVFALLVAGRAWGRIERVILRPTGRIYSNTPIALEIHVFTITSPEHVAEPTQFQNRWKPDYH